MSRSASLSLVAAALSVVIAPAGVMAAPPVFAPAVSLKHNGVTLNGGALSSVAGDFDNDGRAEFVTAASFQSSDGHFRLYDFNLTTRSFDIHELMDPDLIEDPAPRRQDRFGGDLAVGDVDNDGFLDIILPESNNANGAGQVSWFRNPGGNVAGVWTENVITTWDNSSASQRVAHLSEITVGDIDGNGRIDVITRDISHGFWVSLQNTNGTWASRQTVPTNPREGLTLFNPDGDGDLDILLNGVWYETVDAAAGTYQQRPIVAAANWYPTVNNSDTVADYATKVKVGDFNGDGRDDFVITNAEELTNAASTASKPLGVQLFLAPADPVNGDWTPITLIDSRFAWHTLQIGDIDLDGDLDILTGISMVGVDVDTGAGLVAFLNDGDGTSFTQFLIGTDFVYNATLADADGDGDLDVLAPHDWRTGAIRFYENLTIVPEPASAVLLPLGGVLLCHRRGRTRTGIGRECAE